MLRVILIVLTVFIASCAQAPVSFDYAPGAALASLKTYSLSPAAKPEVDYQSLDNARIEAALRQSLATSGMQEVAADQAQVLVTYRVDQERKLEESGVSYGFGFGSGNMGMGVSTGPKAKEVIEGKLVVDMVDPAKKQVLWSAKANRFLTDKMDSDQRDVMIKNLVSAMFEGFPPH